MKKSLYVSLMVLVTAMNSCITFYFEKPLPIDAKQCKSMPRALRGKWTGSEGTLCIDKTKWVSQSTDSLGVTTTKVEFELSDSLIMKKYKQYYFFNTLNTNSFWNVYVGYKIDSLFIIKRLAKEDSLSLKTNLNILPDSASQSNLFYRTPITKKQLVKYIEHGGFTDTLFLFDIKNRTILK